MKNIFLMKTLTKLTQMVMLICLVAMGFPLQGFSQEPAWKLVTAVDLKSGTSLWEKPLAAKTRNTKWTTKKEVFGYVF